MPPQLENGYTKIANEILDALIAYRIPGEERQCLDFIIRKTYGYNKKVDVISNSQFVAATGLKKGNVCRAINRLVQKNLVIKNDNSVIKNDNNKAPTYQFNKDFRSWKLLSKKITGKIVIKSDNKLLSKMMDTKDNINKRNKEKKVYKEKKVKNFKPPTPDEVINYFQQNGYSAESGKKAFEYYNTANWRDSRGNPVKNWKQKMIAVWFKDENKEKQDGRDAFLRRHGAAN